MQNPKYEEHLENVVRFEVSGQLDDSSNGCNRVEYVERRAQEGPRTVHYQAGVDDFEEDFKNEEDHRDNINYADSLVSAAFRVCAWIVEGENDTVCSYYRIDYHVVNTMIQESVNQMTEFFISRK